MQQFIKKFKDQILGTLRTRAGTEREMNLETILRTYARPATVHAAEPVKQRLLMDLRAQKRFNSISYGCLFGTVCLISIIAIAGLSLDLFKGQ